MKGSSLLLEKGSTVSFMIFPMTHAANKLKLKSSINEKSNNALDSYKYKIQMFIRKMELRTASFFKIK